MLNVDMSVDWGGRPLKELERLIDKRIRQLGETAEDALFATANTFLRSIRPLVKVAKVSASKSAYVISDTGFYGGWKSEGDAGKIKRFFKGAAKGMKLGSGNYMSRCVRTAHRGGKVVPYIHPIWLTGPGAFTGPVHIYRVRPKFGMRMTWGENRHEGCWFIGAYTQEVAERHAARLMARVIGKYKGFARGTYAAMSVALARLHNAPADSSALRQLHGRGGSQMPASAQDAIYRAAEARLVTHANGAELHISNSLEYAKQALVGGESAIDFAMAKAANSIAGYLRSKSVAGMLDQSLATPFPEIAKHRRRTA